jgi:hypothetical protein
METDFLWKGKESDVEDATRVCVNRDQRCKGCENWLSWREGWQFDWLFEFQEVMRSPSGTQQWGCCPKSCRQNLSMTMTAGHHEGTVSMTCCIIWHFGYNLGDDFKHGVLCQALCPCYQSLKLVL